MKYKVIGKLHLWGWVDFKEEIGARIIDYDTSGNIINSITYDVDKQIDSDILNKYRLIAIKLED